MWVMPTLAPKVQKHLNKENLCYRVRQGRLSWLYDVWLTKKNGAKGESCIMHGEMTTDTLADLVLLLDLEVEWDSTTPIEMFPKEE